jgi:hypothetical protein
LIPDGDVRNADDRSAARREARRMTTTQWILNAALLAWVLLRNLGTRPLDRATYAVPALLVVVAGVFFLRDLPTAGNDVALEAAGAAAGVALGVLATALTRLDRRDGRIVVRAGAAFGALWIAVIGGRVLFAEWATHDGARAVGEFSVRHAISGADAWTCAFVLMALAMVVGRLASTAVVAGRRARLTHPAA